MARTRVGGWSQMRYQRHVDNFHLLHAKEVVEALERVVREEDAGHIVLAGDEVIIPLLREQLPPRLAEKVIDVLRLDIRTPEHEVLKATTEALREHNTQTDAERVRRLLDEYRAGGLAVVGLARHAHRALPGAGRRASPERLVAGDPLRRGRVRRNQAEDAPPAQIDMRGREPHLVAADLLVARARLTGARVIFVEDPALLADVGGTGALLRYRF